MSSVYAIFVNISLEVFPISSVLPLVRMVTILFQFPIPE